MIDNQLFTRYEFKYLVNNNIANKIYKDSLNFMQQDKFARENNGYFVRSLYFDNYEYDNFFEKVDGIKYRKKFRIRTYNIEKITKNPIYLEAKGRVEDRIFKKRFQIDNNDLDFFYEKKKWILYSPNIKIIL